MTCETCKFWKLKQEDPRYGVCRRYPPPSGSIEATGNSVRGVWLTTAATDWCGEYKYQDQTEEVRT